MPREMAAGRWRTSQNGCKKLKLQTPATTMESKAHTVDTRVGMTALAGRLWLPRRHPTTWSCALSNHHGGGVTACVCWPGGLVLSTPGEIACVPKSRSSSLSTCYRPVSHIRRASGCSQQCPANTVDDQIHTADELSPSPRRQQLKLARWQMETSLYNRHWASWIQRRRSPIHSQIEISRLSLVNATQWGRPRLSKATTSFKYGTDCAGGVAG